MKNLPNERLSIKRWNMDDRPREKMLNKGRSTLSNAELIAILIGMGNKNESAVSLAMRILSAVNNDLNALGRMSIAELRKFSGIGEAKAISIISALELANRKHIQTTTKLSKISNSQQVYQLMKPLLCDLRHEEFWILYFNNSNKLVKKIQLSKGGLTGTLVDVRLVFKSALDVYATGMVLCHNHPSGRVNPSKADKLLTEKIKNAGLTLDIKLLDHLIIGENAYFSFADEQLL